MSGQARALRAALRVRRTQSVIRGLRIAGYRMARQPRQPLSCLAEIQRKLENGATAEQLEQAQVALDRFSDPQPRLI